MSSKDKENKEDKKTKEDKMNKIKVSQVGF